MKNEWLLLMYSLPLKASKERMSLWRRFRQLGAVSLKNSVYILPSTEKTYENFQWLSQEIQSMGGEATLVKTRGIENLDDEEIIGLFNASRDRDYREIITACKVLLKKFARGKEAIPAEEDVLSKELTQIEKRLKAVTEIGFFNAPLCREANRLFLQCTRILKARKQRLQPSGVASLKKEDFQGKQWVTRKRPHVDRLASAWLIRRFIDPQARFVFVSGGKAVRGAVPFDMMGAELSHQGEDCTFETLLKAFGVLDRATWQLAEIVHDVDLRDNKYGRAEAQGLEVVLRGLMALYADDQELLQAGLALFEALYLALKRRS